MSVALRGRSWGMTAKLSGLLLCVALVAACSSSTSSGGGGGDPAPGPGNPDTGSPTVVVTPRNASVTQGGTQQFSAAVTGASNTAVTWTVAEGAGGSITAGGVYTAPTATGTYHVTATLQANAAVSDTATVTVTAPVVTVVIAPTVRTLEPNAQYQFSATVGGTANTAVTWSVDENNGGSVTSTGVYTAPNTAGTYHVRATSQASNTATATATVTVVASGAYITPGNITGDVVVSMDSRETRPISPYIYGLNFAHRWGTEWTTLWGTYMPKYTLNRWGGNNTTPHNWETGYTNSGNDVEGFPNYDHHINTAGAEPGPGAAIQNPIELTQQADASMVVTLPILGYVARDAAGSVPIPVAPGPTTPATPDPTRWLEVRAKNPSGPTATPNVTDEYVYTDDYVKWVDTTFPAAKNSTTKTIFYQLDNEPDIWQDTHVEIRGMYNGRQIATGFDELVDKTVAHASAVKSMIPGAMVWGGGIAGFDGLTHLHWEDVPPGPPPYTGHPAPPAGYTYYVDYFLEKLKQASDIAGQRLIDVFDMHWYTQSDCVSNDNRDQNAVCNGTTPSVEREQITRSLWDPYYVESTWITGSIPDTDAKNCIGDINNRRCPIYLIPRLQARIDQYFPGTKLAIGEYYYFRGGDISAAIANADALGIFGKFGVHAATMWPYGNIWAYQDSTCTSEACAATRGYRCALMAIDIYRNYDGNNSKFGDTHIGAAIADPAFTSPATQNERVTAYASMDAGNPDRVVIVAINKATTTINAGLKITHTKAFNTAEVWRVTGTNGGLGGCTAPTRQADVTLTATNAFNASLPAQSVSVIVLK